MEVDVQTLQGIIHELDEEPSSKSRRIWIWGAIFTLIAHLLFLFIHTSWFPGAEFPHPRINVTQVDPAKLAEIRRQWQAREKSILLDKDKNAAKDAVAPKNARYMSDRNIRVEKEQRAKQTQVIPEPTTHAKKSAAQKSESLPSLESLGIPLHLDAKRANANTQEGDSVERVGGDQAVLDKDLPEGSQNLLNAEESIYYSFYARMYEAIGPVWQSEINSVPNQKKVFPGDYTTAVDVVMDRDGYVIAVRILHDSGITEFDNAVDQAWKRVKRFPNPPQDLIDASGEVHTGWNFTVRVGQSFRFQSAPPERTY